MSSLRTWWLAREPRERQVLSIGVLVVVLMLGWALVYKPMADARTSLMRGNERLAADLLSMRHDAARLRSGETGETAARERAGRSLLALVDAGIRDIGLGAGLKRIEPAGDGRVRLRLEAVPFDPLAGWLETLAQRHGIVVAEMAATATEYVGQVDVQLVLREP
jgi:general secretion pathway protein M